MFVFSGSVSVSALQNKALGGGGHPWSMTSHLRLGMGGQLLQSDWLRRLSPKGAGNLMGDKKEPLIDGNQVYL